MELFQQSSSLLLLDQDANEICDFSRKLILNGVSGACNWFRLAISQQDILAMASPDHNIGVDEKPEKVFFSSMYWKLDGLARQFNGKNVLVAVLDSGVNPSHLALQNTFSIKRIKYGRNFIQAGNPADFNDTDPRCHGTGVASVIAGKHLNPKQKVLSQVSGMFTGFTDSIPLGVAPESSLVICRISTTHPYPSAVAEALQWIYEHNCIMMGSERSRYCVNRLSQICMPTRSQ